jgi:DNA adenine methylase
MPSVLLKAKPFLKWAGGKAQLLEQMDGYFPSELKLGKVKRYVEPFVGGGAVFFHVAQSYEVGEFFLFDVNEELVLAYQTIGDEVHGLIEALSQIQRQYHRLTPASQQRLFYKIRARFNRTRPEINFNKFHPAWIDRAAQIIFLNRTCFNGLFRVNANAEFNVPFGRYKNPRICSKENLRAISSLLQCAEILQGDFTACEKFVDADTFVYFDPPYRPISKTASFTYYAKDDFDDAEQLRLAEFYKKLDRTGAKLMLSNSDPKNENPHDHFFEEAYKGFRIERVAANRMINSNPEKRGKIRELLIMNY